MGSWRGEGEGEGEGNLVRLTFLEPGSDGGDGGIAFSRDDGLETLQHLQQYM